MSGVAISHAVRVNEATRIPFPKGGVVKEHTACLHACMSADVARFCVRLLAIRNTLLLLCNRRFSGTCVEKTTLCRRLQHEGTAGHAITGSAC